MDSDLPSFDDTHPVDRTPASAPQAQQAGPSGLPAFEDTQPIAGAPSAPSPLPDFSETEPTENYSTPEQKTKAALEGGAEGIIGPAAPWLETHVLGVDPKNIAARQAVNPLLHGTAEAGTFVGSMFTGVGEAALLGKIGDVAAHASEMGKIGSAAIKGAIEGGLFQGGDEISKSILGQGDPNDSAASALWHMGSAGVMGGAGGAVISGIATPTLAKIAESKMGTRFSQFLSDMGSRLKFNQENPDMVHALTDQMEGLHTSLGAARDEVYGSTGLKAQNIKNLTQDVTKDQIDRHIGGVNKLLANVPSDIQNDPVFKNAVESWNDKLYSKPGQVTPPSTVSPDFSGINPDEFTPRSISGFPEPTDAHLEQMADAGNTAALTNLRAANAAGYNPYETTKILAPASDIFQATDQLKRQIQKLAKFGHTGSTASVVSDQAASLSHDLRISLEDPNIWNKAGKFQSGLNSAFTEFKPNNDNFIAKFTEKDARDPNRVISPGRVNTYLNQLGKPQAEIKQDFLNGWVNSAEKYQQEINSLHDSLGLQTPLSTPPTNLIKASAKKLSPGSEAADALYHLGIPKYAQNIGLTVAGGSEGYKEGGIKGALAGGLTGALAGAIAPHIETAALTKLRQYGVPSLIRVLSSNAPKNVGAALDFASSAAKGASKLSAGVDALFKPGVSQAIDSYASDKDKENLDKFVSEGQLNRQIATQMRQPAPGPTPVQGFAEGGEVKNMMKEPLPTNPAPPVLKSVGGVAEGMPEHAAIFSAAKSRVNDYLNSVRPQANAPKLAFDSEPKDAEKHRSYQKALDLAVHPLGVINHLKNGTLTPETLGHFKSMWPELHDHLSKKISQRVVQAQMNDEKPNYRGRQSMSLFLGSPLDSTLTPQSAQSIQAMYAAKSAGGAQTGAPKKSPSKTSKLGKIAQDHYTLPQAAAQRATAWD